MDKEKRLKLEHKITFPWLIGFALPTIFSSVFSSLYSTVDGIFVARWVNTDALSAINITMPLIYLSTALGMMFGTGGNALVSRKIGEGKRQEAREDFSLLMLVAFLFSVVLAILCFIFLNPLCKFLGSNDELLVYAIYDSCAFYGSICRFRYSFSVKLYYGRQSGAWCGA